MAKSEPKSKPDFFRKDAPVYLKEKVRKGLNNKKRVRYREIERLKSQKQREKELRKLFKENKENLDEIDLSFIKSHTKSLKLKKKVEDLKSGIK